MLPLVKKV